VIDFLKLERIQVASRISYSSGKRKAQVEKKTARFSLKFGAQLGLLPPRFLMGEGDKDFLASFSLVWARRNSSLIFLNSLESFLEVFLGESWGL